MPPCMPVQQRQNQAAGAPKDGGVCKSDAGEKDSYKGLSQRHNLDLCTFKIQDRAKTANLTRYGCCEPLTPTGGAPVLSSITTAAPTTSHARCQLASATKSSSTSSDDDDVDLPFKPTYYNGTFTDSDMSKKQFLNINLPSGASHRPTSNQVIPAKIFPST